MSSESRQSNLRRIVCPTCGGTGPDVVTLDFDSGMYDASCGDPWHETRDDSADHWLRAIHGDVATPTAEAFTHEIVPTVDVAGPCEVCGAGIPADEPRYSQEGDICARCMCREFDRELAEVKGAIDEHRITIDAIGPVRLADDESRQRAAAKNRADKRLWSHGLDA